MRKKILSFVVVAAISFNSAFAYTHMETVDEAIRLTKAAGNYDTVSLAMPGGNTSTIWFQKYELEQMEGDFRRLVDRTRTQAQLWYTWFLLWLQTEDQIWLNKIYSGSIGAKERAISFFNDRLYQSYITTRNSPSRQNSNNATTTTVTTTTTANGTTVINTTSTNNPNNTTYQTPNRTFTLYRTYTTASNKSYKIWTSSDNRYRFNTSASNGFRTFNDVVNYLEYQNRIIYQAPNSRMYGIFKRNNKFYFNRDEGSISDNSRASVADVKAYINQHNLALPECPQAKEWKCY